MLICGLVLVTISCGGKQEPPRRPLSTRARESALAKSGLPGATGIGAALRVSDSADARRKREDSVANAVP
jgi:hypothetical protein